MYEVVCVKLGTLEKVYIHVTTDITLLCDREFRHVKVGRVVENPNVLIDKCIVCGILKRTTFRDVFFQVVR